MQGQGMHLGALPLKLPQTECPPSRPKALGVVNTALPFPVIAQRLFSASSVEKLGFQMWKGSSESIRLLCPGKLKNRPWYSRLG